MRLWREASWGMKDCTGRVKLTAHAQCIICVASDLRVLNVVDGRLKLGFEMSANMGRIFGEEMERPWS
jgi:hypothetical protein